MNGDHPVESQQKSLLPKLITAVRNSLDTIGILEPMSRVMLVPEKRLHISRTYINPLLDSKLFVNEIQYITVLKVLFDSVFSLCARPGLHFPSFMVKHCAILDIAFM